MTDFGAEIIRLRLAKGDYIATPLVGSDTMINLGIGLLSSTVLYGRGGFSPLALFAASEPGGWYDPSDLTTLFQDAAGTTPVTAVEQPVGLVLDKRTGSVGTNGAKRVNFLVRTEDMTNAAWSLTNATATATVITSTSTSNVTVFQSYTSTAVTTWKYSAKVLKGTSFIIGISGNSAGTGAIFNGSTGAYVNSTTTGSIWSIASYSCSTHPDDSGYWLATVTVANSSADLNLVIPFAAINTSLGTTWRTGWGASVGSTLTVTNHDLRLASEASTSPTYQRITADWPSTMSGSHLSQSTSTARPVLSARVNLLTYTEDFSNAVWERVTRNILAFGSGSTVNATIAPNGTTTADLIVPDTSTNVHYIGAFNTTSLNLAAGTYKLVCYSKPKPNGYSWISLQLGFSGSGARAYFDVANGAKGTTSTYGSGFSVTSYNIFPESNDFYRCEATITSSSASIGYAEILVSNGDGDANLTFAGDGTKGLYIWGADLRPSNAGVGLPAYQRVGAATSGTSSAAGNSDYDTTGFPLYLKFDGTDDSLQSATISPGSVDKAQVFAGVRKLSDASIQCLYELSALVGGNNGTFVSLPAYDGNVGSGPYWYVGSKGTVLGSALTASTFASPQTVVHTQLSDISGDLNTLRLNSTQAAQSTTDQGTGNYLAYPLYIGRRGGSSLPFNGHLYSLILRFSATNMDAATIASTETWINGKTKAF